MSIYTKETYRSWFNRWGLAVLLLLSLCCHSLFSQDDRRNRRPRRGERKEQVVTDTLPVMSDSLRAVNDSIAARLDSIATADSIARVDSMEMLKKSSLDAPALKNAIAYNKEGYNKGTEFADMFRKPVMALFDKIIFKKVREGLGGQMKFFVGGGRVQCCT